MPEKNHRLHDALAHAQGFLEPPAKAEFEAHLATCPECQRSVEQARKLVPSLNAALAAPLKLTTAQVFAKAQAEYERRQTARSPLLQWLPWLTAAVAVLMVLVLVWAKNKAPHDMIAKPEPAPKEQGPVANPVPDPNETQFSAPTYEGPKKKRRKPDAGSVSVEPSP